MVVRGGGHSCRWSLLPHALAVAMRTIPLVVVVGTRNPKALGSILVCTIYTIDRGVVLFAALVA